MHGSGRPTPFNRRPTPTTRSAMRDVDRMRYESELLDTRSMRAWHRGIVAGQSLMLFAAVISLAIEMRRRRILTAIVTNVLENEGGVLRPNDECKRSSPDWG